MRIGLICHLKFPTRRPYSGGLEMFTHALAGGLIDRGHDVTLFATGDSDDALPLKPIVPAGTIDAFAHLPKSVREDVIEGHEDAAYGRLMQGLSTVRRADRFDILHNNSLSPVVLCGAAKLATPMVTTLHVPPLPRMVRAMRRRPTLRRLSYVNVSRVNGQHWSGELPEHPVIHNGTDTKQWCPSRARHSHKEIGEPRAVWTGRILPDKGTHMAVDAAHRAGLPIDLAGPINNQDYFDREVAPRLTARDHYHGPMDHVELSRLVAEASVSVVTPCWDEPFGLVVSEALASGTPVAAFRRGGPAEILDRTVGRLAEPNDVKDLARAITECLSVKRGDCRCKAVEQFSIATMVDRYEAHYAQLADAASPRQTVSVHAAQTPASSTAHVPPVRLASTAAAP